MSSQPKIVALLPMKAHSARVKGKNFREFAEKPLFRWILDTLRSMEEIDRIVINTDAREILLEHGLEDGGQIQIRDRKSELRGDMVSMNKVLADDVASVSADIYLMTHTTNPLLKASTIRAALLKFQEAQRNGNADSLFSVNRLQTRFYREDASPINHDPNNLLRTQDLEPWFEENSNLYIFTSGSFAATNARIGNHPILFETPPTESYDIDDQYGWDLAELMAKHFWQSSYDRLADAGYLDKS
ncbi:MAG: acylneuraminate cytidylyltransferase family protein [Planctomycetota bacterium]